MWGRREGVLSVQVSILKFICFKITFPITRLPEHLNSTISIIETDGGMCMIINKHKEKREHRDTHNTNSPLGVDAIADTTGGVL